MSKNILIFINNNYNKMYNKVKLPTLFEFTIYYDFFFFLQNKVFI